MYIRNVSWKLELDLAGTFALSIGRPVYVFEKFFSLSHKTYFVMAEANSGCELPARTIIPRWSILISFPRGTLLLKWQLFNIDQTCFSSWFLHDLYLCFWDKALLVAWLLRTCLKQAWLIENPQHCGHNFSSKRKQK